MKKTKKNILGLSGLAMVGGMTAIAINLPSPEVFARASLTDSITVTVTTGDPSIDVDGDSGLQVIDPTYNFTVDYADVAHVSVILLRKDENGNVIGEFSVWSEDVNFVTGSRDFSLDLAQYGGYGYYSIKIVGTDNHGVPTEQYLNFAYTSVKTEVEAEGGDVVIDIDNVSDAVESIRIHLYDINGNLVRTVNINDLDSFDGQLKIPMAGLAGGDYIIELVYLDVNEQPVGLSYRTTIHYDATSDEVIVVPDTDSPVDVPNTGGLTSNGLNISSEDYLITGLIAFFVIGVVALGVITKNRRNAGRR